MPIRSSFDAFDLAAIVLDISVPALQGLVADYAETAIAEVDQQNRQVLGRIPPPVVEVDGRRGAALSTVRLAGGVITADWAVIGDVLVWIGETLRERSPVISGAYRDAHTLFADGLEVPIGGDVPAAVEYVFLNPLPYARKIEIGKTRDGRDFVVQVPNRIYERTAADARARFGNAASIKDTYRAPLGGSLLKYIPIRSAASRMANAVERELRVPAIIVSLKAE